MKYLDLIWAALQRHRARTALALLSVVVAFVLFGLLDTVRNTFSSFGQNAAGYDRLFVMSKLNAGNPLPLSLLPRIAAIPGITRVSYGSFLEGTYQGPRNPISVEAHQGADYFDFYPDVEIAPAEREALERTRTGAVAGETLAKKFHWKIGDKIPLQTATPLKDGSNILTLDLVGIYRFPDRSMRVFNNSLYINWDYLDESRVSEHGTVSYYILKAATRDDAYRVAISVDALSANSAHETRTQSDNALSVQAIGQYADLGPIVTWIMGAVFFTLIFLVGHAMSRAVQERIPEFAALKTIGFTGHTLVRLVLSESVLLLLLGSAIGLAVATVAIGAVSAALELTLPIPILPVQPGVWLRGLSFAVIIGFIVGAVPAFHGTQLRIVDALARR
jgi:putative ABC transport system permease protein